MKIKGLLLGMLAYAAMVACTNEDIVKNNVNQPEKVKGNLSLVISSTSNSSRAADNEESGVTDPGIEKVCGCRRFRKSVLYGQCLFCSSPCLPLSYFLLVRLSCSFPPEVLSRISLSAFCILLSFPPL